MGSSTDDVTLIAGDLFDGFAVSERDLLETYGILVRYLTSGKSLILQAGNHDWQPRAEAVSSFQLLATILTAQFPEQVAVVNIDQALLVHGVMVVAHHSNQTKFNETIDSLLRTLENTPVVFHANLDNNFVVDSDHSLNVSREQATALLERNCRPIFAHEHQHRELKLRQMINPTINDVDSCYVLGNQWPTSISDCLNNDEKYAHTLSGQMLLPFTTWSRDDNEAGYCEVEWKHLDRVEDVLLTGFVRVVGSATAAEASEAISAIASFRQRSKAFIVSNAVKVDGIAPKEEMEATADEVKRFDVIEFIRSQLEPDQLPVFEDLLTKVEA